MRHETYNTVAIQADPELVFDIVHDVRRWPELFPPCRSVTVLEETPTLRRLEVTASSHGVRSSWRSEQRIDRGHLHIDFRQLPGKGPFSLMQGYWQVMPQERGAELLIFHRFTLRSRLLHSRLAHALVARAFVHHNSQVELEAIRQYAEGRGG
jgi:aromatase